MVAANKIASVGVSAALVLGGGTAITAAQEQLAEDNEPPVAVDDAASVNEDESVNIVVLTNDSDPDGDAIEVLSATDPANGSVAVKPDGSIDYTPDADFNGADSFEYTIGDGNGGEDTATVDVTVDPVNDDPVAEDDEASTAVNESLVIEVLANDSDVDGDQLTVVSATDPANGSVVVNADGSIEYTPDADYEGDDGFEYLISDGNGGEDTATLSLRVVTEDEAAHLRRDECMEGGWEELGYRNQGLCAAYHGNRVGGEEADGAPWPMQEQWDARLAELEEKRGERGGKPEWHTSESDDERPGRGNGPKDKEETQEE